MLYANATIVTMNRDRHIIGDGAVLVQGKRIAAVGGQAELRQRYPQESVTDLRGRLLMPGLVNTHVHLQQCLMRGIGDDLSLKRWLLERIWPTLSAYEAEDNLIAAELCLVEMLKSGITTFLETFLEGPHDFNPVLDAVVRSGMRAGVAKCVMDTPAFTGGGGEMGAGMVETREGSFAAALDLHARWSGAGDGRVQVWFGPRPPGGSSEALFVQMMALARQHGMRVNMHLAEDLGRVQYIREHYDGASPIDFCERVGMLGDDVVLVHAVNVTSDSDLRKLAASGTHISHNPASNSKLGMGVAPLPRWLDAGVKVSLGTDAAPANNTYDMIRDFRWYSYLHKAVNRDPTLIPAEQVLEMATLGGAAAMGLADQIGSIEVGKKADFIVLDMDKPHLVPASNIISTLVLCAHGSDVEMVVIDGQVVVRDREVLTLDERRAVRRARERTPALLQRAGLDVRPAWPMC